MRRSLLLPRLGLVLALLAPIVPGFLAATPVMAQVSGFATLIADTVEIRNRRYLVATGNVEVLHQGRRLRAQQIIFDNETRALQITGPIVLDDGAGTLILADSAALDADLREGVLTSARVVLEEQLQIAAAEVRRIGGRYAVAERTVASSCQVCADRPTPLWEIRARRVIHDQLERQIHFEHAQFRLVGIPILYSPWLRMPDPTLKRATGFLLPLFSSSSQQGFGVAIPYFIKLGDHRDLTLAPYVASNDVLSLGLRYRQAFRSGDIALTGAVSRDGLLGGNARLRGFARAEGRFILPRGFTLSFDGQAVSDEAYLRDYSLGNLDRIESRISIERTRRDEHIGWRTLHWRSLRDDEDNDTIPSIATAFTWQRHFTPPVLGGMAEVELQGSGQIRTSNVDIMGRDVLRAGVRAQWRRDQSLAFGIVGMVEMGLRGEIYRTLQDSNYSEVHSALTPHARAELRWPLRRTTARAIEILEPVVQLTWSAPQPADLVPNEDSTLVSFDEGNLFALGRFTGIDRQEGGARVTLGLGWTRLGHDGTSLSIQAGRIWRVDGLGQFTQQSGLSGRWSDWLVSTAWEGGSGWGLQARSAFNDSLDFSRAEVRTRLERQRYGIGSALLWAAADPLEGRLTPTAEWLFDGRYAINDFWTIRTGTRFDISSGEVTYASGGLQFMNECLRLDLSLSRRFSSSNNVAPNTEFGLTFDLAGFGGSRARGKARRSCG